MTEEKTTKNKLSARARAQVQRNANAVEREIQLITRNVEILKELNALKLDPANYKLHPDFKATMMYQHDARFLELSRKLDEIKCESEVAMLEGRLAERKDQLENYKSQLAERS
jgi:hypothetical protein